MELAAGGELNRSQMLSWPLRGTKRPEYKCELLTSSTLSA